MLEIVPKLDVNIDNGKEVINVKITSAHKLVATNYPNNDTVKTGTTRLRRVLMEWEVDRHRFLDCMYYDACLMKAAMGSWKSFSCAGCRVWEAAKGQ